MLEVPTWIAVATGIVTLIGAVVAAVRWIESTTETAVSLLREQTEKRMSAQRNSCDRIYAERQDISELRARLDSVEKALRNLDTKLDQILERLR